MAGIGTLPNLKDVIKRTDPNGAIASIIEIMAQENPLLDDAPAVEGNLTLGHRMTLRETLPAVAWGRLNEGIATSKSTTKQVDEACGTIEGYSKIDARELELNGNGAAFRATEDASFVQAMNHEAARALFYESVGSNPERINGFTTRYDSAGGPYASQIIKGTTSNASDKGSIWFINWGGDGAFLIYPKGTMGGLKSEDMGKQLVHDANSNPYTAYVTHWAWKLGLGVKDYRQVARIGNVDLDDATLFGTTVSTNITSKMIAAYHAIRSPNNLRIYCSREVAAKLHLISVAQANTYLTQGEYGGRPVLNFMGVPIRVCDALSAAETAVGA